MWGSLGESPNRKKKEQGQGTRASVTYLVKHIREGGGGIHGREKSANSSTAVVFGGEQRSEGSKPIVCARKNAS